MSACKTPTANSSFSGVAVNPAMRMGKMVEFNDRSVRVTVDSQPTTHREAPGTATTILHDTKYQSLFLGTGFFVSGIERLTGFKTSPETTFRKGVLASYR